MDNDVTLLHIVCMNKNDENFLKLFGQRMAELRKQKGLTQEHLADAVEVHRTYIGFIEQGKRNPTILNIYKISKALGFNLKDLFSTFRN